MTISKDLYLALLSMDSYNRGYGAGIADGGPDDADGLGGVGSRIGGASVVRQSDTEEGTPGVTAGFYAVAYTMGSGGDVPDELRGRTVISYRGTDDYNFFSELALIDLPISSLGHYAQQQFILDRRCGQWGLWRQARKVRPTAKP